MAKQTKWLTIANSYDGLREIKGPRHEPIIVEMGKKAHVAWWNNDEDAWCAIFACACVKDSGYRSPRSAMARSFLDWGKKLGRPRLGCIVVFRRGNSTWQGHVGFYVKEDRKYIWVRGGNQADAVNVRKRRKAQLLGYRWPRTLRESRTLFSGGAAEASLGGVVGAESLQQMLDLSSTAAQYVDWAKYIMVGLCLFYIGRMIWARIDDAQNARIG